MEAACRSRLRCRCFPVNFAKFWITPILRDTSGRPLLTFPAPVLIDKICFNFFYWECFTRSAYRFVFHAMSVLKQFLATTSSWWKILFISSETIFISVLNFWIGRKTACIIRVIKVRLISKFMTSKPGKQTITIHIFPNISKEVNAIRQWNFIQLLEYNMRNIFLEKSHTKCGGETIPRPYSKESKLSIPYLLERAPILERALPSN